MRLHGFARLLVLSLLLALAAGARIACAQAFQPSGAYTDPASQLVIPDTLGGMPRESAYDYEQRRPGLGVSFKYLVQVPQIFADVYIYNGGRMVIPEGIDDPLVKGMFEAAIKEIHGMGERGRYENVVLIGADDIPLGNAPGARRVLRARFSYTLNSGPVYSHIYILAVRNFFVKMRFTYRQDQAAEAVPVLGQALEDLGRIVGPNVQ